MARKFKRRSSRRFSRRIGRRRRYGKHRKYGRRRKVGRLWPNSKVYKLVYVDTDSPSVNFTGQAYNKLAQYKINSAYDVNNAIASTTIPGFTEISAMYNRYRVLACQIKSRIVVPNGAVPVQAGVIMTGLKTIAPASWADIQHWFRANRHCRTKVATQYQQCVLNLYRRLGTVYGDKAGYRFDNNMQAQISGNPGGVMNAYIYISSLDGGSITGVTIAAKTEVTMWIKFYERDIEGL